MLSLQDVCHSRYLLFRNLMDCGFNPLRAATAVEVLLGPEPAEEPEPFEPSEDDLADYREWCMDVDRRWQDERIEADGYVTDADIMVLQGGAG